MLIACVVILTLACVGLAAVATLAGWASDGFIPGMGALLCGCSAVGVLVGKVLRGSGSAPCPLCRAPIHDVERTGRVDGILCTGCGRFLRSKAGVLRPVGEGTVAADAIFGAALSGGFEWPPGCVVCGAPVTQTLPVRLMNEDEASVGLSIVGLAMAATLGAGFLVHRGKRAALNVPHCADHDDGALLAKGGPGGFLLLFRSYPYQRAFCERNGTPPAESPETRA